MRALQDICSQYRKWEPLEDYINRINAYSDNGPLVADNCKCLIESVCKTILEDLGVAIENHDRHLNNLAKQTVEKLGCVNKVTGLVSALVNTVQKIAEFRNEYTETGHGQSVYTTDENRKKVTVATTQFLIGTIEQIAVYLITVYQDEYPQYVQQRLHYEDNADFNDRFDENIEHIQIGEYGPYAPSEVLFYVDIDAYKTELFNQVA